jgi:tetratricopeptide (TPR) repeat protein
MAFDKSRTSPLMKTLIIMLAATFFVGIGFAGLSGLSSCSTNAPLLPGGPAGPGASTDTTAALQAINLKWSPQITSREASITADPENYDLLVAQGQSYFDWAAEVQQATQGQTTADQPLWVAATTYYRRALEAKPGEPNVTTDYAISLLYSRETTQAIAVAEQVRAANPTFSPVLFNLGIFYRTAGDNAKAKEALEAYLKLDPSGANAAAAQQQLTELGSAQ